MPAKSARYRSESGACAIGLDAVQAASAHPILKTGRRRQELAGLGKVSMHFNFSADQILWTLTFAALLVLLVVLLGRDRARRFPWFTTSMVLMARAACSPSCLLPSAQLLRHDRQIKAAEIFLPLADLSAIVSILVWRLRSRGGPFGARAQNLDYRHPVLARRGRGCLEVLGRVALAQNRVAGSLISILRLMDLIAEKTDLFANVLMVLVGLLVVLFGRRYKAGWHSHTQQIAIGLTMIFGCAAYHSRRLGTRQDYRHPFTGRLQTRDGAAEVASDAEESSSFLVLIWWIACLWFDEPETEKQRTSEQRTGTAKIENRSSGLSYSAPA